MEPAAWNDIYSNRGGSHSFPKTEVWASPAPGRAASLVEIRDHVHHGKMRKKMEGGFTERAVASQESILVGYMDLLINQLRAKVAESGDGGRVLDIVQWFVYVTVDIIGDLAFGESFQCLEKGEATEWVDFTFSSIKHAVLGASLRFYPWVIWATEKLTPPSVVKKMIWFWNHVEDKVDRRLARDTERPDFLTLWQRKDKGGDGLDAGEVYANSFILVRYCFIGNMSLSGYMS
jgi:cytochrome P450